MSGLFPSGSYAVMAQRREPPDSLDYFPTPPWATRALIECVLKGEGIEAFTDRYPSAWEPACGEGHMSAVLAESFATTIATDVFDYSGGDPSRWPVGWWRALDFLDEVETTPLVDWIITNPPFKDAEAFARRALKLTCDGVALLVRSAWLEGTGRYERLFRPNPPALIAQFSERVPMTKGRWDPDASTATSYSWVVWLKEPGFVGTQFCWIPPGQRTSLTQANDAARFGVKTEAPLIEAAE